ncbi:guanine nucleotide exchange c9orf72 [Anaeramoeba flamelloides]|uniref:Guanine nucleotide exchange c9orf72 n=1 Tax=Anaeramoeba flamelloides TaxID=1746091 RepID=A0ABQ8Z5H7_9EUKA|nr:guanine nucleotide exchange c9orf72 [Anaeramoeba flamelloides]
MSSSRMVPLISLRQDGYLSGIQLSAWDNVLGPQVLQVWQGSKVFTSGNQMKIAKLTLSPDLIESDQNEDHDSHLSWEYRTSRKDSISNFHFIPLISVILTSKTFLAPVQGKLTMMSLSVLLDLKNSELYLPIHPLVENQLLIITRMFLGYLDTQSIENSCQMICEDLWYFQDYLEIHMNCKIPKTLFSLTIFERPKPEYDLDFLAQVITSHYQTFGSTVVVGYERDQVNYFLDSLSIFLRKSERRLSLYLNKPPETQNDLFIVEDFLEIKDLNKIESLQNKKKSKKISFSKKLKNKLNDKDNSNGSKKKNKKKNNHDNQNNNFKQRFVPKSVYIPDLFLQGMFYKKLDLNKMIMSFYPSTVVDLSSYTVKQTVKFHKHIYMWKNFFRKINQSKLSSQNLPKKSKINHDNNQIFSDLSFEIVKKPAKFVSDFVKILFHLPSSLRESYITQWINLIYKKALVLIKFKNLKRYVIA